MTGRVASPMAILIAAVVTTMIAALNEQNTHRLSSVISAKVSVFQ